MRRLVVALAVAVLAFTLVGCGGGGEAEQPAAPPAEAAAPPASTEPTEGAVFVPFPTSETNPAEVTKNLESKTPMLIFFYDSSQKVSKDIRTEINAAIEENDDADFIQFDLGEHTDVLENGTINVDAESLNGDPEAQAAVMLATTSGVTMAPTIVVSDNQNYIIFRQSGFMDRELIGQQLERVSQ